MDKTALFKLSYGLFVVGVQESGRENGCVINTAAQATDTPCRMLVTMQKQNLTTQMIIMKKASQFPCFRWTARWLWWSSSATAPDGMWTSLPGANTCTTGRGIPT